MFPGILYNYFSDGILYNLVTIQESEGKLMSSMISINKSTNIAEHLKNKSSMSTREPVNTSHFLQLFLVVVHVCLSLKLKIIFKLCPCVDYLSFTFLAYFSFDWLVLAFSNIILFFLFQGLICALPYLGLHICNPRACY